MTARAAWLVAALAWPALVNAQPADSTHVAADSLAVGAAADSTPLVTMPADSLPPRAATASDSSAARVAASPDSSAAQVAASPDSTAAQVAAPPDSTAAPALVTAPPDTAAVPRPASAIYTRLEIHGAHTISEGDVRRMLAAPVPGDSLAARLRRLGRRYYDLGHLHATFTPEGRPDGTLVLRIEEGAALRIAALYIRGTQVIPETVVREILALQPGTPFRAPEIETRLRALLSEYAQRGHLDAEAVLERLEFEPAGVVLGVAISEGAPGVLAEVTVQGNTTTRAGLVERIAGLHPPQPADADRIREAPQLLRRSGLFAAVEEPVLYRAGGGGDRIGVVLHVVETERRNNVYGALGMARDPARGRAYLTGTVDVALGNIYGSGRDLRVGWQRDARLGSRLALGYRERYLFGTPLDLGLDLSQTVRDSSSTWQTFNLVGLLPLNRNLALELGGAFDRSVYHIDPQGNTLRVRGRVGLRFASLRREEDGTRFGAVEVHAEWARRRNDLVSPTGTDHDRVQQTIWGGRFETGVPLALRHVLAARGEWHVLDGPAPVPESELYEFGGARTLRGYREAQFRGDRVAFGGVEYRYGNPLGARLYGFVDVGANGLRPATGPVQRDVHVGYGVGLRAGLANGVFDLAFGLGEERSFADAKVHASLSQRF